MAQHDYITIKGLSGRFFIKPILSFQQMYIAFGGSSKGLGFKDLVCGLVLLTRGRRDEKIKCKYLKSQGRPEISGWVAQWLE